MHKACDELKAIRGSRSRVRCAIIIIREKSIPNSNGEARQTMVSGVVGSSSSLFYQLGKSVECRLAAGTKLDRISVVSLEEMFSLVRLRLRFIALA